MALNETNFAVIILALWGIASWLTHVVVCIKASSWGFLIAGAIFVPVAMVHGTGIWLNIF
ncbi:MAG: Cronobacter phage [Bacteroidota bacterium]|jgi:hypothetical protein